MAYELEQQQLADRLRRAQLLQQAEAPQGQMVSGHYVNPSITQYLAQGLRQYLGGKEQSAVQEEQKALVGRREQAIADALRGFTEKSQGRPADVLPEGEAGPVRGAAAPDMQGAFAQLMAAPDRGLQQFGMQGQISAVQQQAEAQRKAAEQQRLMSILQGSTPQQAIAAGVPPDLVKNYYESRNFGREEVKFEDVGGEKVPVTKFGDRPQGVQSLTKTGNPFSDLVVRGPNGQIVTNAPLASAKESIARAGAAKTNVSVNMPDKKFYEGLGTAVSGQIEKGFEQAQSAVQTLNNANQIASGLEKAFVGPMANQRMTLAQIGQVLGVNGKDATEALTNTRNVIQGLARQELAAAGQMKGQGQITENERAILKRAEAGEINAMTKPELDLFVSAIRKTARSRVATHQRNIQQLGQDPQAATILPYLQIEAPQDVGGVPAQPSGMPQGFRVIP